VKTLIVPFGNSSCGQGRASLVEMLLMLKMVATLVSAKDTWLLKIHLICFAMGIICCA
jgi:hypothetical protein